MFKKIFDVILGIIEFFAISISASIFVALGLITFWSVIYGFLWLIKIL